MSIDLFVCGGEKSWAGNVFCALWRVNFLGSGRDAVAEQSLHGVVGSVFENNLRKIAEQVTFLFLKRKKKSPYRKTSICITLSRVALRRCIKRMSFSASAIL